MLPVYIYHWKDHHGIHWIEAVGDDVYIKQLDGDVYLLSNSLPVGWFEKDFEQKFGTSLEVEPKTLEEVWL